MYSKILLSIGYLSAPFAGPGSAVLTAAGWLSYGAEARKPTFAGIGLIGLLGVAGILTGYYSGAEGLAGTGGVLLLLYHVMGIAAIWMLGIKLNNNALKIGAVLMAVAWLLAVAGASSVNEATKTASGAIVDWGGVSWANEAAKNLIDKIGGTPAIAKAFAAAGAVFASLGFLSLAPRGEAAVADEERIFSIGVY
ncbi:hypothetical protein [Hyperthermus butylicus]|uniref:Uncharacterized protein n=1 Tax=Hyperthermus butylicus (strain DSM 5456 / JCM 9403 / PLM1-5) TaxID=415426 RepID=A2BL13_HYPBU|nr:hypothetical protein [Hyperthermus butylicus]ABM80674.1 hypothetical protein Hbut_0821 [Hyperthermus butylicus DSM 5456]